MSVLEVMNRGSLTVFWYLGDQLGYVTMDDWYGIKGDHFIQHGMVHSAHDVMVSPETSRRRRHVAQVPELTIRGGESSVPHAPVAAVEVSDYPSRSASRASYSEDLLRHSRSSAGSDRAGRVAERFVQAVAGAGAVLACEAAGPAGCAEACLSGAPLGYHRSLCLDGHPGGEPALCGGFVAEVCAEGEGSGMILIIGLGTCQE